ncbi:MAG: methyltransferase domain-containing protein [Pseudonocardiales bacterium]|nr:methyltransferase domain-containing protein [Pseudonocardiales bacterium]MBV9030036.1 methyltransferase domain-containing protein [Pseudonocardiales bacterium]
MPLTSPAAARWRGLLAARAIPAEIRAAAAQDPSRHDPARFVPPATPRETPSRRAALWLLGPAGGTVLDVGCGGGAAGLALVPEVTQLTGLDPSADMLRVFERACTERGVPHRSVLGSWPDAAPEAGVADVVVCHHVGYNTLDLGPFVAALGAAARRGVVVELHAVHPGAWLDPLWAHFHGLRRPPPATADDVLAVVAELGIRPEVQRWTRPAAPRHPEAEVEFSLRRLCLPAERRDEVAEAVARLGPRHRDLVTIVWTADPCGTIRA